MPVAASAAAYAHSVVDQGNTNSTQGFHKKHPTPTLFATVPSTHLTDMSYTSEPYGPRSHTIQSSLISQPTFSTSASPNVDMEEQSHKPTFILLGNLPVHNASNFQGMGTTENPQSLLMKPVMPIYRHVLGGRASLKQGAHITGPKLDTCLGERQAVPETMTESKSVLVREFEKAAHRLTTAVREEQAAINRNPKRSRKMPARFDSPS